MKRLLHKYRTGNISVGEFDTLSAMVDRADDEYLSGLLREEWDAFPVGGNAGKGGRLSRLLRRTGFWTGIAACLLLAVSTVLSVRLVQTGTVQRRMASREVTVRAGNDGQSSIVLPDGTDVVLNARSSITYPSDFGNTSRRVTMSGEGFFDVRKDTSCEFVVCAPGMEITVHGTKFNVYAYPESEFSEMSLVEGSVSLRTGDTVIPVSPKEKVNVSRCTGRFSVSRTDNELETAWMKDRIVFVHEPLSHVVDILERRFGVQISCDGISLSDRYTGTFKDRSITDILDILRMHYGFSYQIKDNHIILTH
ncbi:MAG: DUF4974 domain-containing protein [Bacteroidales bacterium]|nr:DUF4974 domain-containing protein [Bacteroidales bacterium]